MNIQSKMNRWFSFTSLAKSTTLFVAMWVAGAASSASAASGTWLGNGNAWNDTAAWSGGTIADGSTFTANFTGVNITNDVSMALGANRTISYINFTDATTSSHNLTLTGNTLTLGATPSINVTQADRTLTISSLLAGTAGITKNGQGTLTLSGANSITGASTINGGTLVLDYTNQDNRKLPNNSTLSLNGGTIVLKGGTSATETFTSTSFNNGTFFVRDGGTAKVNLNTFGGVWLSVLSFSHENMATTDRLNTIGILGAWFTVGDSWAANASNAADGNIVKYTAGATFSNALTTDSNTNADLSGGLVLSGSKTVNTLRIVSTADNQVLNIGVNGLWTSNLTGANTATGGGLLYAGGANGNYTIQGTTGSLRITNQNGQGQLINVYTGTLTVAAVVGSGTSPLVKSGEGTLVLTKDNAYGSLLVYQGVVRLGHNNALKNTSTVQNGAAIELSNGISIGAYASTITGTGINNGGALRSVATTTSSFAGAITLGGAARINSDSGTLTLSGGVVTGGNTVTFGGAGNTTVSTAAISGTGGLIKDGEGALSLLASNTYTGATTVNGGTLNGTGTITGAVTANGATSIIAPGAPTGTLTVNNNCTIGNKLAIRVNGAQNSALAVTGVLTISGAMLDVAEVTALTNDVIVIASYNSLVGTFATINSPSPLSVDYDYQGLKQIALIRQSAGTLIMIK